MHESAYLSPQEMLWVAAAALAVIALLGLWVWSLRRQVRLRLRVEMKLAAERNLLRQVIDSDPGVIQVKDAAGRYTLANLNGAALFGVSPRSIVGKTDAELLHGIGESLEARIVEQAQAGRAEVEFADPEDRDEKVSLQVGDIALTDVTGRKRWFSAARTPLSGVDETHRRVLVVATDITARKQFQDELQASEAKFRALVEQSLAGIFIQQDGQLRYVNHQLAHLLGYESPADIIDRLSVSDLVVPEERARIADLVVTARTHEIEEVRLEVSALRSDGSAVRLEVHARALEIDGRPAGIGIAIDITERERAAVARERALATAEELARLKTEFMSNMSHELRTPLNGIIGMAAICQRTNDLAKAHQACGHILVAGARLERLVADVLDFSTVETSHFAVQPVPVDFAIAIEPALAEARELAAAKGLGFRVTRAADVPVCVVADPRRLQQILANLLSNAIKFTERGEVVVRFTRDGAWLDCEIADTGIGIAPDHLLQLFRPFEQADGSRTRRYGGTGLGLALTQLIVRRLGGTLAVESELSRGTRARIRLPLVESSAADVAAAAGVDTTATEPA
jgi:PAS domain S-box-containing protein